MLLPTEKKPRNGAFYFMFVQFLRLSPASI